MLHVLLGTHCNNNCLFCMEADREVRRTHIRRQSPHDILLMLEKYGNRDEVLFTSGEPTLCPELAAYVQHAKSLEYACISLITNGRRLAYEPYARRLVENGLTKVTVSIHGHTARHHEALTRTPGSFRQTVAGLRNLRRLKRAFPLAIHSSSVIVRRELPHLEPLFRFLVGNGVDLAIFNVLMAKGRGAIHARQLAPRYTDLVVAVTQLVQRLGAEERRLLVQDIPHCVSLHLPAQVRSDVEEYDQYEPTGSTGLSELAVLNEASSVTRAGPGVMAHVPGISALRLSADATPPNPDDEQAGRSVATSGPLDELQRHIATPALRGNREYYLTHRGKKDCYLRVKGSVCRGCPLGSQCPGVWEPYIHHFGWDDIAELAPHRSAARR